MDRTTVRVDGLAVADSESALLVLESGHPPIWYFPPEDVRSDLLAPSDHLTHCPFKGHARHYHLQLPQRRIDNAAWSYQRPLPDARSLEGYIAFYPDRVDSIDLSRKRAQPELQRGQPNPLAQWLVHDAWREPGARALLAGLARRMREVGIPVWRLWVAIKTLHPLLSSRSYTWQQGSSEVTEFAVGHELLQERRFLDSPLVPIFEGAGAIRRRLEDPALEADYPILQELRDKGATDYVALPLPFSNGQINVISLTTRSAGGFTGQDLGAVDEIVPLLGRLLEVDSAHDDANNLLDTYLGVQSGRRVLRGLVKRGDAENIRAVIWFCDLRDSTRLSASLSEADFLELLNDFFDCLAGAVLESGGEVLRFIGDAALAVFPVPESASPEVSASVCAQAVEAVSMSAKRLAALNLRRRKRQQPAVRAGIGLHLGRVVYGNIGTQSRLEFTVIGHAANEAARIEALTKELGVAVLASSQFAEACPQCSVPMGEHQLKGFSRPRRLFTLPGDYWQGLEGDQPQAGRIPQIPTDLGAASI